MVNRRGCFEGAGSLKRPVAGPKQRGVRVNETQTDLSPAPAAERASHGETAFLPQRQDTWGALSAPGGTFLWDVDRAQVVWADPQALAAWGAGHLGTLLDARFGPDEPMAAALRALRRRLPVGASVTETVKFTAPHLRFAGTCRLTAERLASGRPALRLDRVPGVPATLKPASTAKAASDADTEQRALEAVAHAVCLPFLILDSLGTIRVANGPAAKALGVAAKDAAGRALQAWLSPAAARALHGALAEGPERTAFPLPMDGPALLQAPDGRTRSRPLEVGLSWLDHAGGPWPCVLLRPADGDAARVKALKNDREEADLRSQRKSDALGRVSHALRTPLTAVLGFAEVIGEHWPHPLRDDQVRTYAGHILSAGQEALSLVEDLLDVARLEAGRLALRPVWTDPALLAETCLALVQPLADRASVTLEGQVPAALPRLETDGRALNHVLCALLSHAIERSPAGSAVPFVLDLGVPDGLRMRLADAGPAPSPDLIAALNDREGLAGLTPTDLPWSLGLARDLTRALGGRMAAKPALADPATGLLIEIIFPQDGSPEA